MYILQCSDGSYYTGSTKDIELRLAQHQAGKGANHTKKRLPVKLVYLEEYQRIDDAFVREKQIQGWSRKKKEALINGDFNSLSQLSVAYRDKAKVASRTSATGTSAKPTLPEDLEGRNAGTNETSASMPLPEALEGSISRNSTNRMENVASRTSATGTSAKPTLPEALEGRKTGTTGTSTRPPLPEDLEGRNAGTNGTSASMPLPEALEGSISRNSANRMENVASRTSATGTSAKPTLPEALEGRNTGTNGTSASMPLPEALEGRNAGTNGTSASMPLPEDLEGSNSGKILQNLKEIEK